MLQCDIVLYFILLYFKATVSLVCLYYLALFSLSLNETMMMMMMMMMMMKYFEEQDDN